MIINKKKACNKCISGLCCTEINNLSVKKGNTQILKNINLHVHCGELTAIIGKNGAGKSTLLKAILGENKYSGILTFKSNNKEMSRKPIIGYVPQKLDFDTTSPISVLDVFSSVMSKKASYLPKSNELREEVIKSLQKVEAIDLIDKKLGYLSGGELQRVLLALALQPIPHILLLDEPVSGIDQNGMNLFYELVSKLRTEYDLSIILVSHDLSLVNKYANRVVFINNKTIECIGPPNEVFNNEVVASTFGLNLGGI